MSGISKLFLPEAYCLTTLLTGTKATIPLDLNNLATNFSLRYFVTTAYQASEAEPDRSIRDVTCRVVDIKLSMVMSNLQQKAIQSEIETII